jgi:hypothetical protein
MRRNAHLDSLRSSDQHLKVLGNPDENTLIVLETFSGRIKGIVQRKLAGIETRLK